MDTLSFQAVFHNRTGVLATMHQKEQVIAPILAAVGIQLIVPPGLNTDEFGTFTREVDRPGTQLEAARWKAEKAMSLTGMSLALASEGSFGAHPAIPFLACNREIVVLCDRTHDIEIVGQAISTETNYSQQSVTTVEAALTFADKVGFPSHGLVAMSEAQQAAHIVKGIVDETQLRETVTWLLKQFGQAHLETDMRAMYNPTRLAVIADATRDLVNRMKQSCPQCGCPGFVPIEQQAGLPCSLCGCPTDLTLTLKYHCQKCNFNQIQYYPDGQKLANPAQCHYCNP